MSSTDPETSQPTQPTEAPEDNTTHDETQREEIQTTTEATKKRAKPTPRVFAARKSGATRLPISKVQRIIKADKDLMPARKEAALAVAIATEEFMARLCGSAERIAAGKRRTTIKQEDVRQLVRRVDKYMFLLEMIMTIPLGGGGGGTAGDAEPRKPKALIQGQGRLDSFVSHSAPTADDSEVILNEDGTMGGGGDDDDDFAMEGLGGSGLNEPPADDEDEGEEPEEEDDVEEEPDEEEPDEELDEDDGATTDGDQR